MGQRDGRQKTEIPPGTLYMLILKTLANGPMHGYGIAERIHLLSREVLEVEEGSLYPALQRMLIKGWVAHLRSPQPDLLSEVYFRGTFLTRRKRDIIIEARHARFGDPTAAMRGGPTMLHSVTLKKARHSGASPRNRSAL